MKLILTILLFLTFKSEAQKYTASWTGWGHSTYQVQQGMDSLKWVTIGTVAGKSSVSSYQFPISATNYYYRIKADSDSSKALFLPQSLSIKNDPGTKGKGKTKIQGLSVKVIEGGQIHYVIESPEPQQMQYSLYDMMGRKLSYRLINLQTGVNDVYDAGRNGIYYATFQGYFDFKTVKVIR